ncbi:hypothetical protein E4U42_001360 [Claviceps africana]|uniref:Uncharacterized protein n=1 Tax=Claviceps africana TaxID=83212 RepID=A0A8K0JDJ5_9HYPO|nr:hypothetical protein E4U42_001360 [Claviceps africana]
MSEADGEPELNPQPRAQPGNSRRPLLPRPSFMPNVDSEQPQEPRPKRQGVANACEREYHAPESPSRRGVRTEVVPKDVESARSSADCKYIPRGTALNQRFVALRESFNVMKEAFELLCAGTEKDAVDVLRLIRSAQSHENLLTLIFYHPDPSRRASLLSDQPCPWTTDYLQRETDKYTPQSSSSITKAEKWLPLSRWTAVSGNDTILTHLFKLFWTWDTTPSRLIHRGLLVEAICAHGNPEGSNADQLLSHFCSGALINAILAYAADSFPPANKTQAAQGALKGRDFAREAKHLLSSQPQIRTIASVQAAAILSVYEHAFGDLHERKISESLIDMEYVQMLLQEHIPPPDDQRRAKVQEALLFIHSGFYQLNVKFCLISNPAVPVGWPGKLMATPYVTPPLSSQGTVDKLWIPYPESSKSRISYAFEAIQVEYDLARLAVECLVATEANQASMMPDHRGCVNIYRRLLNWNGQHGDRSQGPSSSIPSWVAIFEAIILALIDYEADFSVRHDFWLSYTCGVAVKHLLLNTITTGPYSRSLYRGCELLYNSGRFMPQANRILLNLRVLADQRGITTCTRVRGLLDAAVARIRPITIHNASYIIPSGNTLRRMPIRTMTFGKVIQKMEK